MMDAAKGGLIEKLSDALLEQSKLYRNLSKELVYFISTKPSTNYTE